MISVLSFIHQNFNFIVNVAVKKKKPDSTRTPVFLLVRVVQSDLIGCFLVLQTSSIQTQCPIRFDQREVKLSLHCLISNDY